VGIFIKYDAFFAKGFLLFLMLFDMNGNAFLAKWQGTFFIDTKLRYIIGVMKVTFMM